MPLGQAETTRLYVPVVTTAAGSRGQLTQTFSYVGVDPIWCRFWEMSPSTVMRQQGQAMGVNAICVIRQEYDVEPMAQDSTTSGERRQVKVVHEDGTESLWEVIGIKTLGRFQVEMTMTRWKT